MSVLVQYLKFLKSSPAGNEKKEKTAALPGYEPQVTGEMPNKKKDEGELTVPITEHGLAKQETPKNINTFATKPVAMRSESSAAVPAFTQPVSNPGRGYNTGVPQPQAQQQPTKIPRVLARIPMANSVTDPKSGTLLDKQGSLGYSRNTGISDVEGEIYVNSNDVELLGKLGFEYSEGEYLGLEKTSEVLDVYSYIEKVAGVPKEVAKLIDDKKAFSAEYLKDMGYSVPKGYEVKGDLVCPVEKTEHSFQQAGKEEKGSSEKTAADKPFGGLMGGMSGGIGLQRQDITGNNQPALRSTMPQLRPAPAQEAPKPVNPAPGSPIGVTDTAPTMSPGTGQVISTHAPLNVNNVPLGQLTPPSWGEVYSKMKTRPSDFVPEGVMAGVELAANRIIPGAGLTVDLTNKIRRGQAMGHIGIGEVSARGKTDDPTGAMIDRIGALGGAIAMYPHPAAKIIGFGTQAGTMGLNLVRDYDQARAQLPDTLTEQPVVPSSNYPATNFSVRPEQQVQPNINIDGQSMAKNSEFNRFVEYFNKTAGDKPGLWANVHAKKARGEKAAKPGDEDYPDKKQWNKLTKAAVANPAQTILITGHSGSGKTTLSRQLAEKLKLPVYRVDAQQSWDDLREHFGKNPELERKALIPGSAENKKYVKDIRKIVHKSLKEINGPAILEGTQLTTLPAKQLEKYRASIVVGGDMGQSIAQRLQRAADKAAAKGITFSPEQLAKKREESQLVADSWHPGIEKFKKLPGVINYNHTEHQMKPLVKKLQGLMGKQAEYKWHKSKDLHRDVTNGRHYPFSFLTGEAKELVDAIKKRDMANFKEEIGDTSYAAQMLAAQATGLNHPVYADLSKFHNREKIWKDIFREKGSTYHPKHMEGGSNFAKPSKIIKALASAGIRISQKEAEKLANKYTGGKMEKEAAAPTQHYEGESVRPFGGLSGGMSGGIGLQEQSKPGNNQPALRPTPPQLRPMPAPEPVNPAFTLTTGGPLAIDTNPINIPTENLAQQNPPSVGTIAKEFIPGPADLLPVATAVMTKKIAPFVPYNLRKKLTRFNVGANVGSGELNAFGRDDDNFGKWIDRTNAIGGAMSVVPNPYVAVPGTIISGSATALNLGREFQKARQKYSGPPILGGNKPAFPTFNAPAVTPQQQPAYQLQKLSEADHPVTSSNIKAVGHDKKEKVLDVAFHSGSEYLYKDVPRSLYARLLKAKSPGKFFNKHIKQDKPFEYEKVAGMPEHIRKAIAAGDKALLRAAQSRSVASRVANTAAKKRKLEAAKLLGNEEPKILQHRETLQKHFPFSVSHEFEKAKKLVDPSYRPDMSKYLGKPKL